jgi:hypothetical protein
MTGTSFADRIRFLKDDQVMDVDFSNLTFESSGPVNEFYDEVDRRIVETGEKWFFLVNYHELHILLEASITFAHRGKKTNLAYSLGSARYAASPDMRETIKERSTVENFDPNLHDTRDEALAYLRSLRAKYSPEEFAKLIVLDEPVPARSFDDRIIFHADLGIMEADFSDLAFERSRDVDGFYDVLEEKLADTGRRWYFLVNYRNCTIHPEAWVAFANRGKRANLAYSNGSVRFDTSRQTEASILEDAKREDFEPNLFSNRDDAIKRILEMQGAET